MSEHTFVLIAYKDSPYLKECAASLSRQTGEGESRVIVATSTPSEFIRQTAAEYGWDYRVNPVCGGGIAADWNFALSCAESKYVTLAHQDDIYLPHYREEVMKTAERFPGAVIIFSDYAELREGRLVKNNKLLFIKRILLLPYLVKNYWKSTFWRRRFLSLGCNICCPAVTFNMEKVRAAGFEFDPAFRVDLDWDAWYRLSGVEGGFAMSGKILMAHRIHAESETTACIAERVREKEDGIIFRRLWPEFLAGMICRIYQSSTGSNS